jgi:3-phytase
MGGSRNDDWQERLVEEMTRRGWLLTVVGTMTAGALVGSGCSNEDAVPALSNRPTTAPARPAVSTAPAGETGVAIDRRATRGAAADSVTAAVETEPVPSSGDAADDPAIWVNVDDPSRSTVIGTDKEGGLAVYDLAGKQLQYLADGQMDNVDLRNGFPLAGANVTLVTASNRDTNTIAIYKVEPTSRRLENVAARDVHPGIETYGSCMYRSKKTERLYYVVDSKDGEVEQWELFDVDGRVDAKKVRSFDVGSQVEGCVADDELARLYIAEEDVGIWRYGAEPTEGDARVKIDSTGSSGHLVADVEGLAIARGDGDQGYLIASSQGDSSYVIYERGGSNPFVHRFEVRGGDSVDGAGDTDGIDVTTADLGGAFSGGLFVAQDGDNDGGNQNYKLVAWDNIIGAG